MALQKMDYGFQPGLFGPEFDLDVVETSGSVSPEDARLRSEAAKKALGLRSKLPGWYEEYLNLLDGNWPWRVAAYIAWAASPRNGRVPETQDQLAREVLGLTSDRQITTWRAKNPAIIDMISTLQVAPMLKHRADVIDALIKSAEDPDYKSHQDRKLFLEITGDYVPTSKLLAQLKKSAGGGAGDLSDDDLLRLAGLESGIVEGDPLPTSPIFKGENGGGDNPTPPPPFDRQTAKGENGGGDNPTSPILTPTARPRLHTAGQGGAGNENGGGDDND